MSTNDTVTVEQQRQRRKRINRMKTGIIVTIALWMIVSMIAIVILSVQVAVLHRRVNAYMDTAAVSQISTEAEFFTDTQEGTKPTPVYDHVVTGIDSPDNIADEGDVHEVYLTFDGSPSTNTDQILDLLKKNGVKATFFVAGEETDEAKKIYKRIVRDGHTLGMHSYSNQYSTIYQSTEAFEKDYEKISEYLENVTGEKSLYYRFPGGSSNEISNVNMAEFVSILNAHDITYFDWNVSAGDTASDYSVDDIVTNVTEGVSRYKTSVVLLHDGDDKSTTVEALEPLIKALKKMDAKILPIDENTKVIQYIKADSVG